VTSLILVIGGNVLLLPGGSSSEERGVQRAAISQAGDVEWSRLGWNPAWPGKVRRAGSPDPKAWTLNYQGVWALRSVGGQPERVFEALALFKKAVDLDPKFKEANYNFALTLDLCSLRNQALEAWDRFLELKPEWSRAREAQQKKGALLAPTDEEVWLDEEKKLRRAVAAGERPDFDAAVSPNREAARKAVEERLLPEWAGLYLARNRRTAALRLELVAGIVGSFAQVTGDRLLAEAVDQLLDARTSAGSRSAIALGIGLFGKGVSLFETARFAAAEAPLKASWRTLSEQGSPMAGWAAFRFAHCLYQSSDYSWARTILEDLATTSRERGYRSLLANAELLSGTIELILGRPKQASLLYSESLDIEADLAEPVNAVKAHTRLASALSYDENRRAWHHRLEALVGLRRTSQAHVLRATLVEAADHLVQSEAAFLLDDEWFEIATRDGRWVEIVAARRGRVLRKAKFGRLQEALVELAALDEEISRISDPVQRETFEVEALGVRAEVLAQRPTDLLPAIDQLIERAERGKYPLLLKTAYLERGKAHKLLGDSESAAADFLRLVKDREAISESVEEPRDRLGLFDLDSEAFDRLASVWVREGRSLDALALMERVRGRFVADQLGLFNGTGTMHLGEGAEMATLARRLPANIVALAYRVDPDGKALGVWIVRRTGIAYRELLATQDEVRRALQGFEKAFSESGESPDASAALRSLDEALLAPVGGFIPAGSTIAIVPAGWLANVPWSALRRPGSGPSLIERHGLLIAPSLRVLLAHPGEPFERVTPDTPLLQVSASLVGTTALPGLRSLPEVDRESAELEGLYRREVTLSHEAAQKTAILAALPQAEVFQFSGHARHGRDDLFSAALLLGGGGGGSAESRLTTADLLSADLGKARLAILVACSSGHNDLERSSAQLSPALALISRGVRQVVATNWDVEDDLARAFSVEFHRQLLRGLTPIQALREVKLEFQRSNDPRQASPRAWAAFDVFGEV
jgi:CHAT domain-containing protein